MSIIVKKVTIEIAGAEDIVDSVIEQLVGALHTTEGILVSLDGEATASKPTGKRRGRKPGKTGAKRGRPAGKVAKSGKDAARSEAARKMWAARRKAAGKAVKPAKAAVAAVRGPGRPAKSAPKPVTKKKLNIK